MKKLLILLATAAFCDVEAVAADWQPMSLLDQRLTVAMPSGSKIEARGNGIMGAPQAYRGETRVVFEDGGKKLVVMAEELFVVAGNDYGTQISDRLKGWAKEEETEFDIADVNKHLVAGIPKKPNLKDDAILCGAAFVRNKDDTIQRIGIYFNPEFYKTPELCSEWTKKILASVDLGSRKLAIEKGKKVFEFSGAHWSLRVDFPAGYVVTTQVGIDFLVYHILEVVPLGTDGREIGIYFGWHPSYQHKGLDEDKIEKKNLKGLLFGKQQEWIQYGNKGAEAKSFEVITPIPKADKNMKAHIFGTAPNEKGVQEIMDIFKTAEIQTKTKQSGKGK